MNWARVAGDLSVEDSYIRKNWKLHIYSMTDLIKLWWELTLPLIIVFSNHAPSVTLALQIIFSH